MSSGILNSWGEVGMVWVWSIRLEVQREKGVREKAKRLEGAKEKGVREKAKRLEGAKEKVKRLKGAIESR